VSRLDHILNLKICLYIRIVSNMLDGYGT